MECELAKVYNAIERTARKEYVCRECGVAIAKGERYLNCSGLWEWGYETHRQHLICAEACELVRDHLNDNECIPFGYLMEWYWEAKWQFKDSRDNEWVMKFRKLMAVILWKRYKS